MPRACLPCTEQLGPRKNGECASLRLACGRHDARTIALEGIDHALLTKAQAVVTVAARHVQALCRRKWLTLAAWLPVLDYEQAGQRTGNVSESSAATAFTS